MNKLFYLLFLFLLIPFVSSYSVNQSIPLSVKVQYDNGVSLSDILVPACVISMFNHDADVFTFRNQSMTPSGEFHTYTFIPSLAGSYTASVLCSHSGDSSAYWFDFDVADIMDNVNSSGRGINPSGGSVLQSVFPASQSIAPEHSSYIVNLASNSVLTFPTSYYADSKLVNAKTSSWQLLRDGNILDSGSFISASSGVYSFIYDFKNLPVGDYQIAESFDNKPMLIDVSVVSRSGDASLISGLVTFDDGSISVVKLSVLIFVLIIIIIATVLLFRSLRRKPVQPIHNPPPRREVQNR